MLNDRCAALTSSHRLNSYPPSDLVTFRPGADGSFTPSPEQVTKLRTFIRTHHVNDLTVPAPRRYFKDPEADQERIVAYLRSWDRLLEQMGEPELLCYTYLIDEPNDAEAYAHTRRARRKSRSASRRHGWYFPLSQRSIGGGFAGLAPSCVSPPPDARA